MSTPSESSALATILLVEDSETDALLTREAFKEADAAVSIHRVDNGERCLEFLQRSPPYRDAPTPDLILLDLNLPVMSGQEVLARIVSDEALRVIPVVVLTSSRAERDVASAYRLRCSSYVTKPLNLEGFDAVVHSIWHFWFSVAALPPRPPG